VKPTAAIVILLSLAIAASAAVLTLKPLDEAGYNAMLKQHAGKVVLMDIWAAWCEPCRAETPDLVKIAKQLGPKGLDYVTVTIDGAGELSYAEKYLHRNAVPFPAYYRKTSNEDAWVHNVHPQWTGTLPALFLYDRSGKLSRAFIGSATPEVLETAIRELLGVKSKPLLLRDNFLHDLRSPAPDGHQTSVAP
jgi:thiol-disulfide isomerase/thioredoxin